METCKDLNKTKVKMNMERSEKKKAFPIYF